MLRLLLIFLFPLFQLSLNWESNFDIAKQRSLKENKIILIHFVHKNRDAKNVKLDKVLFESSDFNDYANKEVVLLKVDLGIEQTADSEKQFYHNSILLERFNNKMLAPYTIITDAEGNVLKRWSHEQPIAPAHFVKSIKESIEAHKQ